MSKENAHSYLVKLNIGGVKYITTQETLCKYGKNYFSYLLSESYSTVTDEKSTLSKIFKIGYIFIDRDGKYFEPILEYLRTGEFLQPPHLDPKAISREASFYSIQIPSLQLHTTSSHINSPRYQFQ